MVCKQSSGVCSLTPTAGKDTKLCEHNVTAWMNASGNWYKANANLYLDHERLLERAMQEPTPR